MDGFLRRGKVPRPPAKADYPGKYTPEQMRAALEECRGIVTHTAKKLRCAPKTVYAYMKRFPELEEARREAREHMIDWTESKLVELIDEKNVASIHFYLRTQGKKHGYVERSEVTGADGAAQKVEIIEVVRTEPQPESEEDAE